MHVVYVKVQMLVALFRIREGYHHGCCDLRLGFHVERSRSVLLQMQALVDSNIELHFIAGTCLCCG